MVQTNQTNPPTHQQTNKHINKKLLYAYHSYNFLRSIGAWAFVNDWSECNATCGGGTQTRTKSCVYADNTLAEGQCTGNVESESKDCNEVPCRKLLNMLNIVPSDMICLAEFAVKYTVSYNNFRLYQHPLVRPGRKYYNYMQLFVNCD